MIVELSMGKRLSRCLHLAGAYSQQTVVQLLKVAAVLRACLFEELNGCVRQRHCGAGDAVVLHRAHWMCTPMNPLWQMGVVHQCMM